MISLYLTTALLGLSLAGVIMWLLRQDHLHLGHGLFWLCIAALAAILGLWPGIIDKAATLAGISYPPAFLLLTAIIVLLIKSLHTDIANTRIERQVKRLNQRLAIAELNMEGEDAGK